MRYELFIGLRYLKSRSGLIFSVGGVAVGIATVVVALSVMNGWESIIRDRMLKSEGHITVFGEGSRSFANYRTIIRKIEEVEGVVAASPVLVVKAAIMDENGDKQTGVMMKAIDPELEPEVTSIADFISGELDFDPPLLQDIQETTEDTIFGGIILGSGVARTLRVSIGDIVRIMLRFVKTPMGL